MKNKINILCSTDDHYVPYCGIMLTSLLENNSTETFDIYIITEGLEEKNKTSLQKLSDKYSANIHIIEMSDKDEQYRSWLNSCPIRPGEHVSLATYLRLLCPILIPTNIDKILYLDCDMIVSDIKELWDTDISNFGIGVVKDESYLEQDKYFRLGIEEKYPYFNAGMLLINLNYWRENKVMERCFECIKEKYENLLFHDQDTLNVVLQNKVKYLPIKYNFQTAFLYSCAQLPSREKVEVMETVPNPVILHYTGPSKPWFYYSKHPYVAHYRHYHSISLWNDYPIAKPSLKERFYNLRNELIWRLRLKKRPQTYIITPQLFSSK